MVTLPAEVLRQLGTGIGENLSIVVSQHIVILRPARGERRRYNMEELLAGVTEQDMQFLAEDTAWAREGDPAGRELI